MLDKFLTDVDKRSVKKMSFYRIMLRIARMEPVRNGEVLQIIKRTPILELEKLVVFVR